MNVDPPPAVPHPCDQNPNPKSLVKPETTFSVRHMKIRVESIPENYPYTLSPIEGVFPNKGDTWAFIPVPFFEFRGLGAPPPDVGTPGDAYIDTTPGAQALYSKSEEEWTRWAGSASDITSAHPHFADGTRARFLWFHPQGGVEWVCQRTIMRRQLQNGGALGATVQSNLDRVSEIIGRYLVAEAAPGPESRLSASEEESELSELSDADFYPSKRARRLAPGTGASISVPIPPRPAHASRSRAPPPSSPPAHFTPDSTTLALERELAALKRDPDLKLLRNRKRELLATLATRRTTSNTLSPTALQTLAKEFNKSCPSTLTPDEAKQALPDLQRLVDDTKKRLLALRAQRAGFEMQLAERQQACEALKAKGAK
ncbi:hypothetical protein B0H16DRAFT_1892829 [Mycena metata]|uniref:Uncharacterized protein n=1 Tax=Mycena metata TaxID=1033252 RepID=A0AAD7I3Y2_9AGAR|nr:hypothetical protein B0H16DRAFT_1892829 [Mycena metata]